MSNKTLEVLTGLSFLGAFGTHTACLLTGVYRGSMNSQGLDAGINFEYIWGANIGMSGLMGASFIDASPVKGGALGATVGGVTAPIASLVGYGIGQVGGFLIR